MHHRCTATPRDRRCRNCRNARRSSGRRCRCLRLRRRASQSRIGSCRRDRLRRPGRRCRRRRNGPGRSAWGRNRRPNHTRFHCSDSDKCRSCSTRLFDSWYRTRRSDWCRCGGRHTHRARHTTRSRWRGSGSYRMNRPRRDCRPPHSHRSSPGRSPRSCSPWLRRSRCRWRSRRCTYQRDRSDAPHRRCRSYRSSQRRRWCVRNCFRTMSLPCRCIRSWYRHMSDRRRRPLRRHRSWCGRAPACTCRRNRGRWRSCTFQSGSSRQERTPPRMHRSSARRSRSLHRCPHRAPGGTGIGRTRPRTVALDGRSSRKSRSSPRRCPLVRRCRRKPFPRCRCSHRLRPHTSVRHHRCCHTIRSSRGPLAGRCIRALRTNPRSCPSTNTHRFGTPARSRIGCHMHRSAPARLEGRRSDRRTHRVPTRGRRSFLPRTLPWRHRRPHRPHSVGSYSGGPRTRFRRWSAPKPCTRTRRPRSSARSHKRSRIHRSAGDRFRRRARRSTRGSRPPGHCIRCRGRRRRSPLRRLRRTRTPADPSSRDSRIPTRHRQGRRCRRCTRVCTPRGRRRPRCRARSRSRFHPRTLRQEYACPAGPIRRGRWTVCCHKQRRRRATPQPPSDGGRTRS